MSTDTETADDLARANEELMQFMYASPFGLIQIAGDGLIEMVNPAAMQLLLQLVRTPVVTNFFSVIQGHAPELLDTVRKFSPPSGIVCEHHHIYASPVAARGVEDQTVIDCTIIKVSAARFMIALGDISRQIAQDRQVKQAETWFASLLNDVNDFVVISLDAEGLIDGVNQSVMRQTGFAESEVIGKTLAMFEVRDFSSPALSLADQLSAARRNGWHLEEGWHKKKSGKSYWCQTLIAVRREAGETDDRKPAGYTVILRDVKRQEFNASKLRQLMKAAGGSAWREPARAKQPQK